MNTMLPSGLMIYEKLRWVPVAGHSARLLYWTEPLGPHILCQAGARQSLDTISGSPTLDAHCRGESMGNIFLGCLQSTRDTQVYRRNRKTSKQILPFASHATWRALWVLFGPFRGPSFSLHPFVPVHFFVVASPSLRVDGESTSLFTSCNSISLLTILSPFKPPWLGC